MEITNRVNRIEDALAGALDGLGWWIDTDPFGNRTAIVGGNEIIAPVVIKLHDLAVDLERRLSL